ncbi:hypothetical protein F8388_018473 [Cannabis sativa]|uniref:Uncharacterized protein n=1 Tax=Cannabis sativa TaxID=3483 RepID=A0A7J6F253_CANSA|nr:hypothetical protein F8388_018473 [Cannabis sativa]KAF4392819.1 hypothetical protein G4B88_011814 [Cannabis sativa]
MDNLFYHPISDASKFHVHYFRYPADLFRRAKINSVLDWHHSNLRPGAASAKFVLFTVLGSAPGIQPNPQAASEAEKILSSSLSKLKSREHLALGKAMSFISRRKTIIESIENTSINTKAK